MRHGLRLLTAAVLATTGTSALYAQQVDSAGPRPSRWTPFLGCWSSSSAGAIGPMVCVVPTDSIDRVEFLSVDGDSIVARAEVDASGRVIAYQRGQCSGVESGRWSADSTRVYIKADYRCERGRDQRSDAVIDLTRSDAFSYIEGSAGTSSRPARVTNFIVQLDTTVFPTEVKRRLPGFRPLAFDAGDLEARHAVSTSAFVEARAELSESVLIGWLQDRGEPLLAGLKDVRKEWREKRPFRYQSILRSEPTLGGGLAFWSGPWGFNWGGEPPPNYLMTPDAVGFGVPYLFYQGGFTWNGWR